MKTLLTLCLILSSGVVSAEWRLVHQDAEKAEFFIDPSNVVLIDGYKRAWVLNNLPKANPQGAQSFKSVEEFDCVEKAGRLMQIAAYAGPMGTGDLLGRRHGNGQWIKTEAGSVDQMLLEASCTDKL